jgi:Icc-related predicted phosphoesterase
MKIAFFSDTHSMHHRLQVPDADVLVFAGDMIGNDEPPSYFDAWLSELPHAHKLVIAGNHDWCFEKQDGRKLLKHAVYLQDSAVEIGGLKFYGSPWQPEFCDWAFNLPRGRELAKKWKMIPSDTDVLITHCAPHGVLDRTEQGDITGCEDLLKRVKKVKPKVHVFGHVHEGYGSIIHPDFETLFVNASVCDARYRPVNKAVVLEV